LPQQATGPVQEVLLRQTPVRVYLPGDY